MDKEIVFKGLFLLFVVYVLASALEACWRARKASKGFSPETYAPPVEVAEAVRSLRSNWEIEFWDRDRGVSVGGSLTCLNFTREDALKAAFEVCDRERYMGIKSITEITFPF